MPIPDVVERAVAPPREMRRQSPFTLVRDDASGEPSDGLTLDGYASVFNRVTVIDSWEGRFKEKVAPGSMKKSFRENPPLIQFDHGQHSLIGSIPIAVAVAGYPREEVDPVRAPEGGAHILARVFDNWLMQPVRDAMASTPPAIKGMSFRFGVVSEVWHDADGKQIRNEDDLRRLLDLSWRENLPEEELLTRTLRELRVPELGPVVWPAYSDTSVSVRSIDLGRLDDPDTKNFLARALILADVAERGSDLPPVTPVADVHESEPTDRPQATPSGAGEHPSAEARRRRDRFRAEARNHRGYLISITRKD